MPRILDAALGTYWAITPDGLDALRTIYEQALNRSGTLTAEDLDRIMAENEDIGMSLHLTSMIKTGQPYSGSSRHTFMFENGVAVMNLIGPIYPRANMMTSSGAVSLQQFTKEFVMAYNDPDVKGIVMNIDSPGGDARGLGDASNLMYAYSKKRKKPVKSFAAGYMASAAYYIGAISQEIVGSQSSIVGSIGTVMSVKAKGQGEYEIVSAQSPLKRPDVTTEDGRSPYQQNVNDLGQIFGEDIAKYRGILVEKVWSDYGQGATLIGPRAKKQGLLDSIGTLDSVIEKVAEEAQTNSYRPSKKRTSADLAQVLEFTEQEIQDMGLKNLVEKLRSSNEEIEDVAEQAQPDNETESSDEQSVQSGQGPTPEPTQTREDLEEQFSDAAELFATQMIVANRIFPAIGPHAASMLLNAKIDDTLFGGKVSFVNAGGEIVEGSREDAVRASYEAMPKHSVTQKAIKGIKEGSVVAQILKDEEPDKPQEDAGPLSADRRNELLGKTDQGRRVLAQVK